MTRNVFAAVLLASGLALSGASFAQTSTEATMVAGVEVSAADLPKVQAQCDALVAMAATENAQSVTNTDTSTDKPADDTATNGTADPASTKADGADGIAAATTMSIDLDTLTLDQCKEAGLVK